MTSRPGTLCLSAIAALLLVAAGGWWWLHGRMPSDVSTKSKGIEVRRIGAARPTTLASNSTPAEVAAKTAVGPSLALPPDNAPLAEVFDELKARADAGDAHAACRLAVDLLDCGAVDATAQGQLDGLRTREATSEHKGNLTEANGYAEMQAQVVAAQQRCARIGQDQIALAGNYLRAAAKAGVPEAMLRYADGQGFGRALGLAALRDPNFDTWRREAPEMMRASLAAGRPGAAMVLADAYRTDTQAYFSALVPNDATQARAYSVLFLRLMGKDAPAGAATVAPETLAQMRAAGIDTSAMDPTPDELRQAEAQADQMYRDYFGGRPLTDKRSMSRWLVVGPRTTLATDTSAPPRCN